MFDHIPIEIRLYDQWILWKFETSQKGKLVKIPYSAMTGRRASVMNPHDWVSYDEVMRVGRLGGFDGIGFVLTKNDPFLFIDLDNPKDCTDDEKKEIWSLQQEIYEKIPSYAEKSPSGKGLHIICKGSIPRARKTKAVEMYDSERYMTMTGDIFRNAPISDMSAIAHELFLYLNGTEAQCNEVSAGDCPQVCDDSEILRRCSDAVNGQKFNELFSGDWTKFYSSQSEADLALIDIIAFYTQNKEQIKRIFLSSNLGQREKAQREAYFNYNLAKALDNVLPPPDIDLMLKNYNEAKKIEKPIKEVSTPPSEYTIPGGLMGEIAQFIYNSAPRPVPEMALVASIGLMAGIAGRAYNVSRTGLNQYILLLAATGTGKEGISHGINALMNAVSKEMPAANEFIGPDKIGSEQALTRYMAKGHTSFVSIIGEFGIQMAQMASDNASPHLMGVKRSLLDLYNKSGVGQVARGSIYSDSEKNVNACSSPAFSLIGESVPERFYNAIDEAVVADGLLPRFMILEYKGKRPPLREDFQHSKPSQHLVNQVRNLINNAKILNTQNKAIDVLCDSESESIFRDFDKFCDGMINATGADVTRQMWNRAHLKALKLAALIAVGENIYTPIISRHAALWAIDMVSRDVNNILSKFKSGAIGGNNDEILQLRALCEFVADYTIRPYRDFVKYGATSDKMHRQRVIPWCVIQRKLHKASAFRSSKVSGTDLLRRTIRTMVDRGDLVRLSPQDALVKYETRQECYFVANDKIGDSE